ncbi:non-specific lipid transfer protein GPI-anchored 2 [Prunus yedoensis var. nudiflora]|uniref:Non-specific lipid transfer protein GPI-anchored 2 n=1 Tax=Prunus yedoensis var. nudiflora TaxID=2094558 RepID=A0A314YRW7_PRUYE|nr:non-specific lipid transfer protein GPI-anchored 2 [Prunus yedoensis var. nudiflora]
MEISVPFFRLAMALAMTVVLAMPVYGQVGSPCNASAISSLSPCMSFLTNSSSNGTSPTADCCNSLKALTSTSRDCLCLIVTGSVPFQLPINRSLAISLPRACNIPGVPVQCQATVAPIPAPGPSSLAPTLSPGASPSGPTASSVPEPTSSALSPESDTTPLLTPPSTTGGSGAPTATTGSRPVLTPSAAFTSYRLSPSLMLFASGILALKFF